MNNSIKELWHGNITPQEDSRNNYKEMKELLGIHGKASRGLGKEFYGRAERNIRNVSRLLERIPEPWRSDYL